MPGTAALGEQSLWPGAGSCLVADRARRTRWTGPESRTRDLSRKSVLALDLLQRLLRGAEDLRRHLHEPQRPAVPLHAVRHRPDDVLPQRRGVVALRREDDV